MQATITTPSATANKQEEEEAADTTTAKKKSTTTHTSFSQKAIKGSAVTVVLWMLVLQQQGGTATASTAAALSKRLSFFAGARFPEAVSRQRPLHEHHHRQQQQQQRKHHWQLRTKMVFSSIPSGQNSPSTHNWTLEDLQNRMESFVGSTFRNELSSAAATDSDSTALLLSSPQHSVSVPFTFDGDLPPPPPRLVVAIAGGGGQFVSTLSATPGASKVLVQGNILYDREAYHAYTHHMDDADGKSKRTDRVTTITTNTSTNTNTTTQSPKNVPTFRYVSFTAAHHLAAAALQQACALSAAAVTKEIRRARRRNIPDPDRNVLHRYLTRTVGIGCASALTTTTTTTSSSSSTTTTAPNSTAYIAVHQSYAMNRDQGSHELSMSLRGKSTCSNQFTPSQKPRQDRFAEDVIVSHGILTCLERALGMHVSNDDSSYTFSNPEKGAMDFCSPHNASYSFPHTIENVASSMVVNAANRILSNQNSVVALIPWYHSSRDRSDPSGITSTTNKISFTALSHFSLPPTSMIFPGSFNPVHAGHIRLAQAALLQTVSAGNQSSHEKEEKEDERKRDEFLDRHVVWFEISLTNADKPPLSASEVERRISIFAENFAGNEKKDVHFHWGILLTNAPLFRQKVELLQPLLAPNMKQYGSNYNHNASSHLATPCLDMIIGTDTLVRLVDDKYYQNSPEMMEKALSSMPARFIVGGRVIDQQQKHFQQQPLSDSLTSSSSSSLRQFFTGEEQVAQLSSDELRRKFILLSEEAFRVDLSSTEIRNKVKTV